MIREYFHPSTSIVDAALAAEEIRILRPDLNDQQLAETFGISSGAISMLLLVARASPEDRAAVSGGGLISAHSYLKAKEVKVEHPLDLYQAGVEASPEMIRDHIIKRDHGILEEMSK